MPDPIIGPAILAGLTGLVGHYWQNRKEQIDRQRTHRANEVKTAKEIFENVSVAMDSLAYYSREVMWALVLRPDREKKEDDEEKHWTPEDHASWTSYKEYLRPWNESKSRNLTLVRKYFGQGAAEQLEDIQERLEKLESRILATYYGRTKSRDYLDKNNKQRRFFGVWNPKGKPALPDVIAALTEDMVEKIQREEIGALRTSNI